MRLKIVGALVIGLVLGAILGFFVENSDDDNAGAGGDIVQTDTIAFPQPVSPQNSSTFVESDVTLEWKWDQSLADNEIFVVQFWLEGNPIQDAVWTKGTTFDAKTTIDSYVTEAGNFYWKVGIINYSEANGYEGMASEWSPIQMLTRVRREPLPSTVSDEKSPIALLVEAQGFATKTEQIDFLRNFINVNSTNERELGDYAYDIPDVINRLYAYSLSPDTEDIPLLWCDSRSLTMISVLGELGIEGRLVYLYNDNYDRVIEHTFIEVFNPDTQLWEVSDSDFNVYFMDTETGQRANIERLVFGYLDTIVPCSSADNCGWHIYRTHLLINYLFEAYRYPPDNTFYVNPDRFDVTKRFPDNGNVNLSEYTTGNSQDFVFKFDTWAENRSPHSQDAVPLIDTSDKFYGQDLSLYHSADDTIDLVWTGTSFEAAEGVTLGLLEGYSFNDAHVGLLTSESIDQSSIEIEPRDDRTPRYVMGLRSEGGVCGIVRIDEVIDDTINISWRLYDGESCLE